MTEPYAKMRVDAPQDEHESFEASGKSTRSDLVSEYLKFAFAKQASEQTSRLGVVDVFENGSKRVEESGTLHFRFRGEYKDGILEKVSIGSPGVSGKETEITRNADGNYTVHSQNGDSKQLRNVRFYANARMVTYEDEQGRELIFHKGDTIYKNGRPGLTAKGLMLPRKTSTHLEIPSQNGLSR